MEHGFHWLSEALANQVSQKYFVREIRAGFLEKTEFGDLIQLLLLHLCKFYCIFRIDKTMEKVSVVFLWPHCRVNFFLEILYRYG